ncbi:MAG: alkaline phosphatase family protein [Alphaproteobacteria bacterium]
MKFLVLVFDGLRADHVTPELMPNLSRLAGEGVHFPESRSVFPSETRVNQASLITGCHPARHGLVANKFHAPELRPGEMFNTANYEQLDAATKVGRLLDMPSLAERLRAAGGSLAVAGCGTPGGNRLLNLDALDHGEVNVSLHGPARSATPDALAAMVERIGPVPRASLPNSAQLAWLADAYMDFLVPEVDPTVAIVWFSEPDGSYHYRGVGSRAARAAITACDRELGRLLAWIDGRDINLVVLSDHGHLSTLGGPVGLPAKLARAGLGTDVDAVAGLCGSLYLNGADPDPVCRWLRQQDWCGPVFARGEIDGALPLAAANLDHPRAGDIVFVLAQSMAAANGAPAGVGRHDNGDIPTGCGMHGGLTLAELNNVLVLSGPAFGDARRDETPAGIVDVAPTLLTLLGLPNQGMDGRDLLAPAGPATGQRHATGAHTLTTRQVDGTVYLDRTITE